MWDLKDVERFAASLMDEYYGKADTDHLIAAFAEDIVWTGAGKNQEKEGREAVAGCFRNGRQELVPCHVYEKRFVSRTLGGGSYLCELNCWLRAKIETGAYIRTQRRVTFIFREKEATLEIIYIHSSIPCAQVKGD